MKTPCQELGYKVGDKFEIIRENNDGFSVGTIVSLCKDDGTAMPLFSGNNHKYFNAYGKEGAFTLLANVKPIKPKKAKRPWIKWEGGECPVPVGTLIDVKYRDGYKQKGCPAGMGNTKFARVAIDWTHDGVAGGIVAYRLAKPKKAEPTVQREANGRPVGAKVGDLFRVIKEGEYRRYRIGDIVQFCTDDKSECPFFLLNGLSTCIHWGRLEPCPAPLQPESELAKPEWEILWGSEKDFEGAPEWAVYTTPAGHWAEGTLQGARMMWSDTLTETTVQGLRNFQPRSARRLKQPK